MHVQHRSKLTNLRTLDMQFLTLIFQKLKKKKKRLS